MATTNGITPAEGINISQSVLNAARPSISNEINSKVSAGVNTVASGVDNLKPGQTPPENIKTVNLSLGAYPLLGITVIQADMDAGIVQGRKLQDGTWEKVILPFPGTDRFVEKQSILEGGVINSFDPSLVMANTVFNTDLVPAGISESTSGRTFSGLQPAAPNTFYQVFGGGGPVYLFDINLQPTGYASNQVNTKPGMAGLKFVQASKYIVGDVTEFISTPETAYVSTNGVTADTFEQVKAKLRIISAGESLRIKRNLLPADVGEALMLDGVTKSPISVVTKEIQSELLDLFDGSSTVNIFDASVAMQNTVFNTDTATVEASTSQRTFSGYTPYTPGQEYTIVKGSGPVYLFNAAKQFVAYVSNQPNGKTAMLPFEYVPPIEYAVNEVTRFTSNFPAAFMGVNGIAASNFDQVKSELKIYKGNAIEGTKKIKTEYLPANIGNGNGSTSYMMELVAGTAKAYNRGIGVIGGNSILRFNFLFYSDPHFNSTNARLNLLELNSYAKHPLIKDDISAVVCAGDVCNGEVGKAKATTQAEIVNYMNVALDAPVPTFSANGNHDTNDTRTGGQNPTNGFANAFTKAEQYNLMIKPVADKWSQIKAVANKMYLHADFPEHKIRIISTDAYDWPIINKGDGSLKYKSELKGQYFSQAQMDWLFTTLRDTPAGYAVIVVTHCPLRTGLTWNDGFVQGVDQLPRIINAWKKGLSYTHNWSSSAFPELNTNTVFNFSGGATNREFICYLSGHVHSMIHYTTAAFPEQHGLVVPCMWTAGAGSGAATETLTIARGENEEVRNSFAHISVDRYGKQFITTMFGAHKDGEGMTRERTQFVKYNV